MARSPDELALKALPQGDTAPALAMAQRCRDIGEPEEAESICLDVLTVEPENQAALVLLLLARTDLLDRGLPDGVARAREPLEAITDAYDRAYYAGIVCERQARWLLRARGRRSSFVAWDWFQSAMDHFEAASQLAPSRVEPVLRFNACVRLIERDRHCAPGPEEPEEHGIE
jgi:hypothetical protein